MTGLRNEAYAHNRIHFGLKKEGCSDTSYTRMHLENTMLSEMSQSPKGDTCHTYFHSHEVPRDRSCKLVARVLGAAGNGE